MKWIIVAWPLMSLFSTNRNRTVERIAIVHTVIAVYVSFLVILGTWEQPGRWGLLRICAPNLAVEITGWALWVVSLLLWLLFFVESEDRFDPFSLARLPARYPQLPAAVGTLSWMLIAYTCGHFGVPSAVGMVVLTLAMVEHK